MTATSNERLRRPTSRIDPAIAAALVAIAGFAWLDGLRPASTLASIGLAGAVLLLVVHLRRDVALHRWTERALLQGERRYAVLEVGTTDLVADVGDDLRLAWVSPRGKAVLDRAPHELVGRDVTDLVAVEDVPRLADYLAAVTAREQPSAALCRARRTDGAEIWLRLEAQVREGDQGLVVSAADVTARRQAESALDQANAQLQRLQLLDEQTGIANRRCFDLMLPKEAGRAARARQPLALLLVGIDQYDGFQDIYGLQAADRCMRAVSIAIARQVGRPADLIARFGRDAAAILLPETDAPGARGVAMRVHAAVQALAITHCANPDRLVTVSIGIAAAWPQGHARDSLELIELAGTALARARQTGGGRFATEPPDDALLAAD